MAEFSIGQVAERFGLSVHTLRFYESEGLLPGVRRGPGGRRVYDEDDLEWLTLCLNLRATGMAIPDIRRYVEYALAGDQGPELAELLRVHRVGVVDQLDRLQQTLELIDHKIDVYGGTEIGQCRGPVTV